MPSVEENLIIDLKPTTNAVNNQQFWTFRFLETPLNCHRSLRSITIII